MQANKLVRPFLPLSGVFLPRLVCHHRQLPSFPKPAADPIFCVQNCCLLINYTNVEKGKAHFNSLMVELLVHEDI